MAKRLIIFLFLLLLLPLISSAQVTNVNSPTGYIIEVPIMEYIPTSQNYLVHNHVYNISNGIPIGNSTTKCNLHIYNSSGNHIIEEQMDYDTDNYMDWKLNIKATNFSKGGQFTGIIWCNSTTLGGFTEWSFHANTLGVELSSAKAIIYAVFLSIFVSLFILVIYFIGKLPDDSGRNDDGDLISLGWLKYLRSVLAFVDWMLLIAILYLVSNIAYAYFMVDQLFAKTLFVLYQVCFRLTLPIIIIWFIWIFVQIIQDKKMNRLISKGIYPTGGKGNW